MIMVCLQSTIKINDPEIHTLKYMQHKISSFYFICSSSNFVKFLKCHLLWLVQLQQCNMKPKESLPVLEHQDGSAERNEENSKYLKFFPMKAEQNFYASFHRWTKRAPKAIKINEQVHSKDKRSIVRL